MKVLSSNINANNEMINDTNESIHIQIIILIRNKIIFQIQNRGNHHNTKKVMIQDIIQTRIMFIKFLKNV
jgi:hypothetical protein